MASDTVLSYETYPDTSACSTCAGVAQAPHEDVKDAQEMNDTSNAARKVVEELERESQDWRIAVEVKSACEEWESRFTHRKTSALRRLEEVLRRVSNDPNDVAAFCASLKDANASFVTGLFDVCFHETSMEVGKKPWETVDDDLRQLALRTLNGICLVDARACRQLSKETFVKEIVECIKQDGTRRETDQVGVLALLQTLALREHRVDHEFRRIGGVHALSTVLANTSASTEARKKAAETLAYVLHSTAQIASDVDVSETLPLERKEAEEMLSEPLVQWLSSGLPLRSWQSEEEQANAMREWWEDLVARLDTPNGTVHEVGADASSEGPTLLPSDVETPVSNT